MAARFGVVILVRPTRAASTRWAPVSWLLPPAARVVGFTVAPGAGGRERVGQDHASS